MNAIDLYLVCDNCGYVRGFHKEKDDACPFSNPYVFDDNVIERTFRETKFKNKENGIEV